MFDKLVFSIVSHGTVFASVGPIRKELRESKNVLVVRVSSLVVLAVTNRGESLSAELALVGLLPGVGSHVNQEVSLLCKYLSTV